MYMHFLSELDITKHVKQSSVRWMKFVIFGLYSDVCWLRLDFESFQILGPATTTEPSGGSCPDTFTATVTKIFEANTEKVVIL